MNYCKHHYMTNDKIYCIIDFSRCPYDDVKDCRRYNRLENKLKKEETNATTKTLRNM